MAFARGKRGGEGTAGMPAAETPTGKRELLVSKTWLQVAGLVGDVLDVEINFPSEWHREPMAIDPNRPPPD